MTGYVSDETPFISVIIPGFNRFHYIEECVNSIHEKADFPFELIIHDDGSVDGTAEKIPELSKKLSAAVFSYGLNFGLAESINRLVRIAGSNYILMLNADMKVERPMFQDIFNILQKPYIGYITPLGIYINTPNAMTANGTPFTFTRGVGSGCALAFRKDVWTQVKGWNNRTVASSNADVSFMVRVLRSGYFNASLVKEIPVLTNMSMDRERNKDSTIGRIQYDCSLPKIFNSMEYQQLSRKICSNASDAMQITYRQPHGETNIQWWHDYVNLLITSEYKVDWKIAEEYNFGHIKWKSLIENAN
jgi:glycosyltransferase involved in cell wall biosynthesis